MEDHTEEVESEDDGHIKAEEQEVIQQGSNKRNSHKMPRNTARTNSKVFI